MIRVLDESVACTGKCVFGHIDKHDHTPGANFSNGVYTPLGGAHRSGEIEPLFRGLGVLLKGGVEQAFHFLGPMTLQLVR
jgi:hypothetical protein